jgi:hypothetical protein
MAKAKKRTFSLGDEPVGEQLVLSKKSRKAKVQTKSAPVTQPDFLISDTTNSVDQVVESMSTEPLVSTDVNTDVVLELSGKVQILQHQLEILSNKVTFLLSYLEIPDTAPNDHPGPVSGRTNTKISGLSTQYLDHSRLYSQVVNQSTVSAAVSAMYIDLETKSRRSRNIVVQGLLCNDECSDQDIFTEICKNEFNLVPTIVRCRRLGTASNGKIQPVLYTLASDEEASCLLSRGRQLRRSPNEMIRQYVYINADLTPAESSAAYQLRCMRRKKASRSQTSAPKEANGRDIAQGGSRTFSNTSRKYHGQHTSSLSSVGSRHIGSQDVVTSFSSTTARGLATPVSLSQPLAPSMAPVWMPSSMVPTSVESGGNDAMRPYSSPTTYLSASQILSSSRASGCLSPSAIPTSINLGQQGSTSYQSRAVPSTSSAVQHEEGAAWSATNQTSGYIAQRLPLSATGCYS